MILRRFAITLCLVLTPFVLQTPAAAQPSSSDPVSSGVAVVELFTSQGCSSCPPADRLLTEINALAARQALPVYTLSMHVDYWNRLGWTDPYSSRVFTERQYDYADSVGASQVYTPQMIVNGEHAFVGSDARKAQRAITTTLNQRAPADVTLRAEQATSTSDVVVHYDVMGAGQGSELVVCVVTDPEATSVPRGENAGQTLVHRSVVRALRVASLNRSGSGEVSVPAPPEASAEELEIVAFVQQRASRRIDGAAQVTVMGTRRASRPTPL